MPYMPTYFARWGCANAKLKSSLGICQLYGAQRVAKDKSGLTLNILWRASDIKSAPSLKALH